MITADRLRKVYRVPVRGAGLLAAAKSVFRREVSNVVALDDVSFSIERGERVGFLGPNGAGKTTTLKILSGLLHPTSGSVTVAGHVPGRREPAFLRRIMLVLGQKQQLLWDLPPTDTFELNRVVYDVPLLEFRKTLDELVTLLGLEPVLKKPVRQLSLGERMKCELAAALLHRPDLLFLDEPTIGLDVAMQASLRAFILRYCEEHGATLLLTSHYMDDVAALCPRVIVVDKGKVAVDEPLAALARRLKPQKRLVLRLERPVLESALAELGTLVSLSDTEVVLDVERERVSAVVGSALAALPVSDLVVEEPPLDIVMRQLFAQTSREHGEKT